MELQENPDKPRISAGQPRLQGPLRTLPPPGVEASRRRTDAKRRRHSEWLPRFGSREGPGDAATEAPAISGNDDAEAERLNVPTVPEAATPAPDTQEGTPDHQFQPRLFRPWRPSLQVGEASRRSRTTFRSGTGACESSRRRTMLVGSTSLLLVDPPRGQNGFCPWTRMISGLPPYRAVEDCSGHPLLLPIHE